MVSRRIKLTFMAAVAVALIANPAFAGSAQKRASATEAYASVSESYPTSEARNVYTVVGWDGRVAGADPDRNIRFQLMRDAFANEN